MASDAQIVFLGTGCSSGVPHVPCLTGPDGPCATCLSGQDPNSKDRRLTTSLLVMSRSAAGRASNVVIDAGKSFYQASLRWFPQHGVRGLDAVLLTHAHFDAIGGLDDLRAWTMRADGPLPVHLRPADMAAVRSTFFYLAEPGRHASGGTIANLEFVQDAHEPLTLGGVEYTPLEVEHGAGFTANGYKFGGACYLSDVSALPDGVKAEVAGCDLLILDALRSRATYGTHLTLERALEYVGELRPRRALFVGMCHNLEHAATTRLLEGLQPQFGGTELGLAYDGLRLELAT